MDGELVPCERFIVVEMGRWLERVSFGGRWGGGRCSCQGQSRLVLG